MKTLLKKKKIGGNHAVAFACTTGTDAKPEINEVSVEKVGIGQIGSHIVGVTIAAGILVRTGATTSTVGSLVRKKSYKTTQKTVVGDRSTGVYEA